MAFKTYLFFYFLINFIIVALQCCVNFYCTAKWVSHTYKYIPSLEKINKSKIVFEAGVNTGNKDSEIFNDTGLLVILCDPYSHG